MYYLGGKSRQGRIIAEFAHIALKPGQAYVEPFCGAMWSATAIAATHDLTPLVLSDNQVPLVRMWSAIIFEGWEPPSEISEDEYNRVKAVRDPEDPMTAYCGYAISFAGKWFGGYARNVRQGTATDRPRVDYAVNAKKSTMKKAAVLRGRNIVLTHADYEDVLPQLDGAVVYLDPPYANRTLGHANRVGGFDHAAFWDHARRLSEKNTVLATEFTVPPDFTVLHSWGDTVVRHHSSKGADGTAEVLVCHESQVERFRKVLV